MKTKLFLLTSILLAATALAFAADAKARVTFNQSVKVAGKTLRPGDYEIEWNDAASATEVIFRRGTKKVVTVPAKLLIASHPFVAFTVCPESGINRLLEIDANNTKLRFDHDAPVGSRAEF
jgi:hypothetical protein